MIWRTIGLASMMLATHVENPYLFAVGAVIFFDEKFEEMVRAINNRKW